MILAALALAADLPARPPPAAPADGDCTRVEPLRPVAVTRTCASLSVPPADFADLLAAESWGTAVHDACRVELAASADRLAAAADREAWWRSVAERPAPALSPAAWFGLGAGAGVLAVLGGALAVRAVAEAPLYAD